MIYFVAIKRSLSWLWLRRRISRKYIWTRGWDIGPGPFCKVEVSDGEESVESDNSSSEERVLILWLHEHVEGLLDHFDEQFGWGSSEEGPH